MPLDLSEFANGDTDYVAKHNSNVVAIEAAFAALEAQLNGSIGAAISVGEAFKALFGTATAVIGSTSYACSGVGTTLTVQPGFAWNISTGIITRLTTASLISFSGLPAGAFYISASPTGTPQRNTSPANALYAVTWLGAAFGPIIRIAPIVWGAADWMQASTAYGQAFDTLDARLEFTEAQVGSAGLARINQTGRLTKALSASHVTLTDVEANNTVIEFTGAISAAINCTVPVTGPRQWLVVNNTTGNFRITFKTAAGAGVILPTGGAARIYHDGSNTVLALRRAAPLTLPSSATLTADYARADIVRCTLTANSTITLTGAVDGQRCVLEVTQDGTGGRTLAFGGEVIYGSDLSSISLPTAAGDIHQLGFIYNAATGKYRFVAQARGF